MQIILQKANIDSKKIKTFISRLTVEELNKLSEPCYYPDWKRHFHELLSLSKLTENDIKSFIKRFYIGTKAEGSMLQSDVGSNLLIILMYYFLEKKDVKTFSMLITYYMIRQYGNFIRRMLSFCQPEVFAYTLDNLNTAHLFKREKTIANALYFLGKELTKRYTKYFIELNNEKIADFTREARHRIAQSLKSFSELYYDNNEKGLSINNPLKSHETGEDVYPEELEKGQRISKFISDKICVYKEVDYKAADVARKLTKISTSLSTIINNSLKDLIFADNIKFIVELYLKNLPNIKSACGNDFIPYIKKLMSIKRTSQNVYFKSEVNKLLLKILEKENYLKQYNKLTNQTQFQINSYLAIYLASTVKNVIC